MACQANPEITLAAPIPPGLEGNLLVDTAWLAGESSSDSVRILDVRSPEDYRQGHIPGSINLPRSEFTIQVGDIENLVPSPEEFEAAISNAGVGPDTHVVIVDGGNLLGATRLLWTLDYFGHPKTSVLHGGLAAWTAEDREVSRVAPQVDGTTFTATPNASLIVDIGEILKRYDSIDIKILDNRSPAEYSGEDVRAERGGHVPGAINIDWANHLSGAEIPSLNTAGELRVLYENAGIFPGDEVASYCQTAIRATHGYMVLKLLGYDSLRVYDGSWIEWGNRDDTPIEQ